MYLMGIDIGSSSVKASIVDGASGKCVASAFYPKQEMKITALQPGWAEQSPELWWENLKLCIHDVMKVTGIEPKTIDSIGISYQMQGHDIRLGLFKLDRLFAVLVAGRRRLL